MSPYTAVALKSMLLSAAQHLSITSHSPPITHPQPLIHCPQDLPGHLAVPTRPIILSQARADPCCPASLTPHSHIPTLLRFGTIAPSLIMEGGQAQLQRVA
ncbi:hypothetical protein KIL84_016629 [Mauremys mutica]|uniref:Uncharacterized protein n=1 Tax=Mauremys mutica TaxID=74926 RepID=A0A9D3X595_9SAUR|nr:hypothetical protein KIL84_016629 [Mauremys mutica]